MYEDLILGIDIGGTKTLLGLFDKEMKLLTKSQIRTNRDGFEAVYKDIKEVSHQIMCANSINPSAIHSVGISCPGPLSPSKGIVNFIATLGWRDIPISDRFEDIFKCPVYLNKDTNCAALAEQRIGAGKGYKNMVYITLSTGIGGGIIINGEPYYGNNETAGEIGHICIEMNGRLCECGCRGCLQAYASGESIARIANEQVIKGTLKMPGKTIDSKTVAQEAKNGNTDAIKIWNEAGAKIGQAVSILLQLIDVEAVIFGGSLVNAWELFSNSLEKAIKNNTYSIISKNLKLLKADLGCDACLYGAAMSTAS